MTQSWGWGGLRSVAVLAALWLAMAIGCADPTPAPSPDAADAAERDTAALDVVGSEVPLDVASEESVDAGVPDGGAPDAVDVPALDVPVGETSVDDVSDAPDVVEPRDRGVVFDAPDVFDVPDLLDVRDAPEASTDVPADRSSSCAATEALCSGRCVDLTTDAAHCGACGRACAAGEACRAGACGSCHAGEITCGGRTVDRLNDPDHCGSCGHVCPADQACVRGACVNCGANRAICGRRCALILIDVRNCGGCGNVCPSDQACINGSCAACPSGQTLCNGECVSLTTSPGNCGACGRTCAPGEYCSGGACGCARTVCGGACVNLNTDARNCGRCGNVCAHGGGCNDGYCTPCSYAIASCNANCTEAACCFPCGQACTALEECSTVCRCTRPRSLCDGACIDTSNDPHNCGRCGNDCGPGGVCQSGSCRGCPQSCEGECVTFATDRYNCGACHRVCGAGFECRAGACVCPSGTLLCGGRCVSPSSDPRNCGACGTVCPANRACVAGGCVACTSGRTVCNGACFDTATDRSNCGACGNVCPASAPTCVAGACACASPYIVCSGGSVCAFPYSSTLDCGACGVRCAVGEQCNDGRCGCSSSSLTACNGTCVDLRNNRSNCGACGRVCADGERCTAGACVACPAGQTGCGFGCYDLTRDAARCGSCETQCGSLCVAGRCACPWGLTPLRGSCVALQVDSDQCGAPGVLCRRGEQCVAGRCAAVTGPPPNDHCADATPIVLAAGLTTVRGTFAGADSSRPLCFADATTVFYRLELARRETVLVNWLGSSDVISEVSFVAGCSGTTFCASPSCPSQAAGTLAAGSWILAVQGHPSSPRDGFELHILHAPTAPGEVVVNLRAPATGTLAGTLTGASDVVGSCGPGPERSIVFVSCVDATAGTLTAATCDPGSAQFDSLLGWYDAETGEGRCEDDSCGVRSRLSATLPAGPGLRVLTVDSRSPAGPAFSVPYEFR